MEKPSISIKILQKTDGFKLRGGSGAVALRDSIIYTAAATLGPRPKSVVIYNRSAMGICYLHSGSDKTDKKCCNLHGIRDVVRQIHCLEAILRIYKSVNPYHYGGHYNNRRNRRYIVKQPK